MREKVVRLEAGVRVAPDEDDEALLRMTEDVGRLTAETLPLENTGEAEAESVREQMKRPGIDGSDVRLGAIVLLLLTYSLRFRQSDEAFSQLLELIAFILPAGNRIPRSLYMLRKLLGAYVKLPKIHYYCAFCYTHVERNARTCSNPVCVKDLTKSGAMAYFVLHDLVEQIARLFQKKQFCKEVRTHRFKHYRKKKNPTDISDVYDGQNYKRIFDEGFLAEENNISFCMNTDGVPVFISSKIQMWPVYLMINELPLAQRKLKENVVLYGIWIGRNKPMMWSYLKPLKDQMETISKGVSVTDYAGNLINVAACILSCVCDLPAKSMVSNNIFCYLNMLPKYVT